MSDGYSWEQLGSDAEGLVSGVEKAADLTGRGAQAAGDVYGYLSGSKRPGGGGPVPGASGVTPDGIVYRDGRSSVVWPGVADLVAATGAAPGSDQDAEAIAAGGVYDFLAEVDPEGSSAAAIALADPLFGASPGSQQAFYQRQIVAAVKNLGDLSRAVPAVASIYREAQAQGVRPPYPSTNAVNARASSQAYGNLLSSGHQMLMAQGAAGQGSANGKGGLFSSWKGYALAVGALAAAWAIFTDSGRDFVEDTFG